MPRPSPIPGAYFLTTGSCTSSGEIIPKGGAWVYQGRIVQTEEPQQQTDDSPLKLARYHAKHVVKGKTPRKQKSVKTSEESPTPSTPTLPKAAAASTAAPETPKTSRQQKEETSVSEEPEVPEDTFSSEQQSLAFAVGLPIAQQAFYGAPQQLIVQDFAATAWAHLSRVAISRLRQYNVAVALIERHGSLNWTYAETQITRTKRQQQPDKIWTLSLVLYNIYELFKQAASSSVGVVIPALRAVWGSTAVRTTIAGVLCQYTALRYPSSDLANHVCSIGEQLGWWSQ